MIEKPKRPKQPRNQERQPPRSLQELIERYDLDNIKIYDFLDELVGQINDNDNTYTENISSLQSQINDKNAITIGLNADTSITSTANYQTLDVSLTKQVEKIGTKLSLSSGKVLIGEGVSEVLVSGCIQTQGDNQMYGLKIIKNTTTVSNNFVSPTNASYNSISLPPMPVSVTSGDTIKLSVYINNSGATKNLKADNGKGTYLTVQVIE